MEATAQRYPVTYDIEYPGELSRWLIFVKWLLAIPHYVVVYLLGILSNVCTIIAFFSILFTKRYPRGLFDFVVGVNRWSANLGAYTFLMRDEYPPFSMDAGTYPVTYDVEYPEELSRWLIFVKWLLVIPHILVLFLLYIVVLVIYFIAFFAILLTKKFPESMFGFVVGTLRWQSRVNAYVLLLRDEYPPFSMDA
jgi:hypothetical protein